MSPIARGHAVDEIAEFRAFNRFYTRQIGVLDAGHLNTPYSLGEARLIYEAGTRKTTGAAELARALALDPAAVSRAVGKLREQGLLELSPNAADKRQTDIALTEAGRAAFSTLDPGSDRLITELLSSVARSGSRRWSPP